MKTICFSKNQYIESKLALLANCKYKVLTDYINDADFVVNQNQEIIYLNQLSKNKSLLPSSLDNRRKPSDKS